MVSDRSNGIYRSIFAALVGLVIVAMSLGLGAFFGALHAPYYSNQSEQSTNGTARAEQRNPNQIDRDRAGLPYIAERIASTSDPANADEREKRDLAAQEAAALWGFWILCVSAIGALVTMVGTGFLLWQIMLTREAVEDTGKATLAMQQSNEIARFHSDRSNRPLLKVRLTPQIVTDDAQMTITGKLCVFNEGQEDATWRSYSIAVVTTAIEERHDIRDIHRSKAIQVKPPQIIYPGNDNVPFEISSALLADKKARYTLVVTIGYTWGADDIESVAGYAETFAVQLNNSGSLDCFLEVTGKRMVDDYKPKIEKRQLNHNGSPAVNDFL